MNFKWILLISSCLILSASSARRRGGGSSSGVSRGATSFTRPSTSSVLSGSPRFSSSPSFSGRGPRTRTSHVHRTASAPPLSSLPHSPNSLHVPRPASAPPLSSLPPLSNSPKTGGGIPKPPPLPPNSFNHAPPLPPPKSNLPQNVPKSGTGPAVITPIIVSPIMRIPSRRNTTTNGNSTNTQNPNRNHSKPGNYPGGNTTAEANLSKLPPLQPLQTGKNSTGGLKNTVNLAKGNAFNTTIRDSPKNTTKSGGVIGNSSGRNVTGNAKLNGTANGFPQVSSGNITNRNFTLSSNGINVLNSSRLANHTRHNNTRNATGNVFQADVTPISQTQPSPIGKFPWDTVTPGNPQQTTNNNMSPLDNSAQFPPQNYDANNGYAPRKPRSDVHGVLTKKIIKGAAAMPSNGIRLANLNSGLIAAGLIVYFCNRV